MSQSFVVCSYCYEKSTAFYVYEPYEHVSCPSCGADISDCVDDGEEEEGETADKPVLYLVK